MKPSSVSIARPPRSNVSSVLLLGADLGHDHPVETVVVVRVSAASASMSASVTETRRPIVS